MSDGIDRISIKENVSFNYFQDYTPILDRSGNHISNVFSTNVGSLALGTFYFIHGYGGSPIEFALKIPMQQALAEGFNVVAIESLALSSTSGTT